MTPIAIAYAVASMVVTYIVVAAIVDAMKRRGFDAIGRLSAVFAPAAPALDAANGGQS